MLKITILLFTAAVVIGADRNAKTNTFQNELKSANYVSRFDTSNGIFSLDQGVGGISSSGASQYISPEGTPVHISYTADERGYIAEGSHIPTPHPIPKYILDSLEHNRLNPQEDDSQGQQYQQSAHSQQAPQQLRSQYQINPQTQGFSYKTEQRYQQQYQQQQAQQSHYTVQQNY